MIARGDSGSRSLRMRRRRGDKIQFGLLFTVAAAIFLMSRAQHPFIGAAEQQVTGAVSPVLTILAAPVQGVQAAARWVDRIFGAETENEDLRRENQTLRVWRRTAEELMLENRRLRNILAAQTAEAETLATARVVAVAGGAYVRSVLVDAGRNQGITSGLPVVNEEGVVGRTILVGAIGSRVLLVTDLNSRIPVRIERSDQTAIAIGRNDDLLNLDFLPVEPDVVVGDRILTSGHGGVFPPDLLIGSIVEVDGDRATIRPAAALNSLDYVRVLSYRPETREPKQDEGVPLVELPADEQTGEEG